MFRWLDELLHADDVGPARAEWEQQLQFIDNLFGVGYRSGAIKAYTEPELEDPEDVVQDVLQLAIDKAEQRGKWAQVHALEDLTVRHGFHLAFYAGWNDALDDLDAAEHVRLRRNDADARASSMWSQKQQELLPLIRREIGYAPDPARARRAAKRAATVGKKFVERVSRFVVPPRRVSPTPQPARRAPRAPTPTPMRPTVYAPSNLVDIASARSVRASQKSTRRRDSQRSTRKN